MSSTGTKNFGQVLRERRDELNLSLKEAENATSIRMNHLQAIEEGLPHKLPSPVYAEGFVRQYAIFLGIDADKFFQQHPEISQHAQEQEFSYGIGTLEKRGSPGVNASWLPNLLWGAVLVGILGLAWLFARYLEVL